MIFAALYAKIDGFGGTFVEAHQLDAATTKKIPKRMIGRTLTAEEASALTRPPTRAARCASDPNAEAQGARMMGERDR